jgi:2-dehydro-3-deoxyphosphogluconate aldolase/(4S)-4-hydroxy-2-oxoglutarate aldolase
VTLDEILALAPVIPVITIERAADAAPLARALVKGGLPVLEVTLRTPAALDAITAMAEIDGAVVGAGTVLDAEAAGRAAGAGARFLVSPGFSRPLAAAATNLGLPLLAGVATPSELMAGLDAGLNRFKFFPAVPSGGVAMLQALAGPFPQARFCPTGGITAASAPGYLALPNVACVGGTWITPPALLDAGDWAAVEALASAAAALRPAG